MDWDCGFSTNSPEFLQLGTEEMEELRSEKTVKATKVSRRRQIRERERAKRRSEKGGVAGVLIDAHQVTKQWGLSCYAELSPFQPERHLRGVHLLPTDFES